MYHSGYDTQGSGFGTTEGPYRESQYLGVNRLITSVRKAGIKPGGNVYAELGSTWKAVMTDPTQAAHVIGKLLVAFGEDNVVWGTDSIWYGSPQDQIQAFRAFQISNEFQERYGYPELTAGGEGEDLRPELGPALQDRSHHQRVSDPAGSGRAGAPGIVRLECHVRPAQRAANSSRSPAPSSPSSRRWRRIPDNEADLDRSTGVCAAN